MSFSGKRYRRIGSENIEELIKITKTDESLLNMFRANAPIFSFTRLDELTFRFTLQTGHKHMWYDFRLGEEFDMEMKDGRKLNMVFTLENDNVLKQTLKKPNGKIIYFTKEFGEKESKMTITMEGTDAIATVFYEIVK
ncbi:hypothetical protein K1T71_007400 [Dendrolimus kikuchii]|uniref:Uncharacterized protein n=1 Tax=Dendrolimus kikuchii TaxID=765133 RepID=A0ACC1D0B8_9NEOP|nr:hypothetical protein K1T71_007400 [Dendrolimus kikuchii]